MKFSFVGFLLLCAMCSPLFAQSESKTDQYQTGKIISVDNRPVEQGNPSNNPPLASNVANHDISIQVGDTIYAATFQTGKDYDLSWLRDKDIQVKIKGKVMSIKRVMGPDTTISITSTSKATAQ
jgi:hypothetical protein